MSKMPFLPFLPFLTFWEIFHILVTETTPFQTPLGEGGRVGTRQLAFFGGSKNEPFLGHPILGKNIKNRSWRILHFWSKNGPFFGPLKKVRFFDFHKNFSGGCQILPIFSLFFNFWSFLVIFCDFGLNHACLLPKKGHFRAKKGPKRAHFWGPKTGLFIFEKTENYMSEQSRGSQKVGSVFDQFLKKHVFLCF